MTGLPVVLQREAVDTASFLRQNANFEASFSIRRNQSSAANGIKTVTRRCRIKEDTAINFFTDTPEDNFFEYLMQEPPRQQPYHPVPKLVVTSCKYCLYYKGYKTGCTASVCCLPSGDRPAHSPPSAKKHGDARKERP